MYIYLLSICFTIVIIVTSFSIIFLYWFLEEKNVYINWKNWNQKQKKQKKKKKIFKKTKKNEKKKKKKKKKKKRFLIIDYIWKSKFIFK